MTDAAVTAILHTPPVALAAGSLTIVAFVVGLFVVVAYGSYTVKGSGISMTPYRRDSGPAESPNSVSHDITQDVRDWERGTEGHHGDGRRRAATGESDSQERR